MRNICRLLFIGFVFLSTNCAIAQADIVTFADQNIYQSLLNTYQVWGAVGKGAQGNGYTIDFTNLTLNNKSGINAVQVLSVLNTSVSSLVGIEKLTALTSLDLQSCNISTVQVLPPNLQYLNLYGNNVSSLPPLPSTLLELGLTKNNINSMSPLLDDVQNLTSLTKLYLDQNNLTSIPFLPPNIQDLDLASNDISVLPSVLPPSLLNLNLNNNAMLSLPPLPGSLVSLKINNNQLTNLPPLPSTLTSLDASFNKLSKLSFLPSGLIGLTVNDNGLTDLPQFPTGLKGWVYLQNNNLDYADLEPVLNLYSDLSSWSYWQKELRVGDSYSLSVGQSLTLDAAKYTNTSPGNMYQWFKDGSPLQAAASNNPNYTIQSATVSDAGLYSCKVTNNVANAMSLSFDRAINVSVNGQPYTFLASSRNFDVYEHSTIGSSTTINSVVNPVNVPFYSQITLAPDKNIFYSTTSYDYKVSFLWKLREDKTFEGYMNSTNAPVGAIFSKPLYYKGKLYIQSMSGGALGGGTIFSVDTRVAGCHPCNFIGNNVAFTVLHSFPSLPVTPWNNFKELSMGSDGFIYGVYGTAGVSIPSVFKVDTTGSNFQILHDFKLSDNVSALAFANDGSLYGTVDGPNNPGFIFRLLPDGSNYSIVHVFNGTDDGTAPSRRGLIKASTGEVYGFASGGGQNNMGTIFKVSANGIYSKVFDFPSTWGNPTGAFVEINGELWAGATKGGANNLGVLFKFNLVNQSSTKVMDARVYTGNGVTLLNGGSMQSPSMPPIISTITAKSKHNAEVLLPVKVQNFSNIVSSQFEVDWDPAVATFVDVEGFGLSGMDQNSFGVTQVLAGKLVVSWLEPSLSPQTLADGSAMFNIRFKLTGNYGASTAVTITNVELSQPGSPGYVPVANVTTQPGSVSIDPTITSSAKILYVNNQPVSNVQVDMTGSATQSVSTDATGSYTLTLSPQALNETYTLTPNKLNDPNPTNGIDVADVTTIHRHILNIQPLTTPQQFVAADVNNSGTVSTIDLVFIQSLILNMTNNYPGGSLWTFMPSTFTLDPANPYTYPTTATVALSDLEAGPAPDFTAIKLGDVDFSRDNTQQGRAASGQQITLDIRQEMIVSDDGEEKVVEIPIRAKNFSNLSGYQFTVTWDAGKLEYTGVTTQGTKATFGDNQTTQGNLTALWYEPSGKSSSLADGDELFTLQFKSKGGTYKDVNITGEVTPVVVIDHNLQPASATVTWSELEKEDYSKLTSFYPNPFSEIVAIEFYTEQEEESFINITDALGRNVLSQWMVTDKGRNRITWDGKDTSGATQATGVYIVELTVGGKVMKGKVVKR